MQDLFNFCLFTALNRYRSEPDAPTASYKGSMQNIASFASLPSSGNYNTLFHELENVCFNVCKSYNYQTSVISVCFFYCKDSVF